MEKDECYKCIHWLADEDEYGRCRRYPPVPIGHRMKEMGDTSWCYVWPVMEQSEWCGEFQGYEG